MYGCGAAAKGNTFLNAVGANGVFEAITDNNILKINLFCPGHDSPIIELKEISSVKSPILFVILAWNLSEEIISDVKRYRGLQKDVFIKFFPNVQILPNKNVD